MVSLTAPQDFFLHYAELPIVRVLEYVMQEHKRDICTLQSLDIDAEIKEVPSSGPWAKHIPTGVTHFTLNFEDMAYTVTVDRRTAAERAQNGH